MQPDTILIRTICKWQGWDLTTPAEVGEQSPKCRRCEKIRLPSGAACDPCSPHCLAQTPVMAIASSSWARGPAPSARPPEPGEARTRSPGSFLPELMAQAGSSPERHFASLLLIAIRSRQSRPQDLNAIFSLNYAKSFREGGEII